MKRKVNHFVVMIVCLVIMVGCGDRKINKATFTNLKPSISIGSNEYIITQNTVNEDDLEKQIARVTTINNIVSYTDEKNPYKKIGRIYKIKNESIDEKVAIEINEVFYVAEKGN